MKTHYIFLVLISDVDSSRHRQIPHFYYVAGPSTTVPPSYMVYGPAELDANV
jgi:hypothetical protein